MAGAVRDRVEVGPRPHRKVILPAAARRKKLSFALTPLADAMFQLLIFFMLSSSLAPYSLITLTPGAAGAAPGPQAAQSGPQAIWHLGAGTLRMGTQTVPLDRAGDLIARLRAEGSDEVLIFASTQASVQDVAAVLNLVTLAQIGAARIIAAEGR